MLGMKKREKQQQVVALSPVIDYMWWPKEYENVCLYDWIQLHDKRKIISRKKKMPDIVEPSIDVECDSNFENDYDVHDELNNRTDDAQDLRE